MSYRQKTSTTVRKTNRLLNQWVYDRVVLHLRWMRDPSRREDGTAAYRSPRGGICSIGCLIPDNYYRPEMEGRSVTELIEEYPEVRNLFAEVSLRLLTDLQLIHDHLPNWGLKGLTREALIRLERIGTNYYLDTGALRKKIERPV